MVIFDTQSRNTAGEQEDKSEIMSVVMEHATALARHFECLVMLIHHPGWEGNHPRGSTSVPGALETLIKATKDENDPHLLILTSEKQKDGEMGATITFRMEVTDTGTPHPKTGKPQTTLVPRYEPNLQTPVAKVKPDTKAGAALAVLREVIDKGGTALPDAIGETGRGVPVDTWRKEFYRGIPDDPANSDDTNKDTKKKAFRRSMEDLQARKAVIVKDGWAWLASPKGTPVDAQDQFFADTVPPPKGVKVTEGL